MRHMEQPIWQINITPFVDVLLAVLIIVMIAAPMLTRGINVNLPKAGSSKSKVAIKDIVISIDKDGVFYIGRRRSSIKSIRSIMIRHKNRRVLIKADTAVPYGTVVRFIDMTKSLGITKIGLLTTPRKAK